jgi:UDP-N-acetylglucosamine acyltransferase
VIDPHAIVSPQAELAADVEVGPFTVIGPQVSIGAGTWIGPHAVVNGPTSIGRDCRVFQFASIGDEPQDKKYRGEQTRLEVGDRNVFREFCTVNRGTAGGHGVTRVGNDNLFMAYAHVAHDCVVGDNCVMANYSVLAGHVEVGDWVILAGYAGVHQFCKVGAHAFLGNNAAVTRDVPPYLLVSGTPAEPKGINSEGLKRRDFSPAQITNLKNAYRVLYRSGLKLAEASARLGELASTQPEIQPLVDFLSKVTRSIVR